MHLVNDYSISDFAIQQSFLKPTYRQLPNSELLDFGRRNNPMSVFYPLLFSVILFSLFGLICWALLVALNHPWWKFKFAKRGILAIPLAGVFFALIWAGAFYSDQKWLILPGAVGVSFIVILQITLIFSLPLSGLVHGIIYIVKKIRKWGSPRTEIYEVDKRRRAFLKAVPAIIPSVMIASATSGIARSFEKTRIPNKTFYYPELPHILENLKILQISDSHLGLFLDLDNYKEMINDAMKLNPDLVLLTGDIADNLDWLPETLRMSLELKPKYGTYACLGNHEYYRGIDRVRSIFDKSTIPLLINDGLTIEIDGGKLFIGGTDDPRSMGRVHPEFYKGAIEKSIQKAPEDSFTILMCHRPQGFDFASEKGLGLTLSGHTHGGQIGLAGRSFFENLVSYKYLWGHYLKPNGSQLYTSAGVGHWLPFRLGCPPEAPLITRKREIA